MKYVVVYRSRDNPRGGAGACLVRCGAEDFWLFACVGGAGLPDSHWQERRTVTLLHIQ